MSSAITYGEYPPQPLRIAIFKPPTWQFNPVMWAVDRLIQFRTWSPYTHAGVVLDMDRRIIISATWPHIKKQRIEEYPRGTVVEVFSVDRCPPIQAEAVRQWFLDREGHTGYDLTGLLGFLIRGRIQARNKFFCSEAVVTACYNAGVYLFAPDRCPAYKVSPGKLRWSPLLVPVATWKV